ncbi:signal peptidase II [Glaciecola punicea ACAM 611]|jgi:signal peptidase II|uniref:Lipoprotein signal peptidase n=1 Tax=Glaciecola punicea ACAM 611 TaxID=1121923 RepID=H5T806_9ALTE|nr:signal peptidase II [Glaciecola punicea]GAB54433.1 signal peptidase II [Glaciecola punicea ACAM 611]
MLDLFKTTGLRFLWISAIIFILDQWTKYAIVQAMTLFESIQITGFFNLTYVHNYGAAFSFLYDAGGWQVYFLSAVALTVSALILWWLRQTTKEQLLLPVAFSFILGGALGNVFDRIMHGYVIDFLDFYYGTYHWPAFNVADSAIFIGAGLLILDMFKNKEANKVDDK